MFGIHIAITFEEIRQTGETLLEGLIVLSLRLRPLHLGECRHTWQSLILQQVLVGDILRPEVCLGTKDMRFGLYRQAVGSRIKGIDLLHGNESPTTTRLELHILCLLIVEVAEGGRRHHHIVARLGGLCPRLRATPRHNHRILRRAVEDLVPSQGTTMLGGQEIKHTLGKMSL